MGAAALACLVVLAGSSRPSVTVSVGARRVPMGRTVTVSAVARWADGSPAAGRVLLPYVNARRWGSHEVADASGRARFLLPLPRPGAADVQVAVHPAPAKPSEQWIWSSTQADSQTVFLQGVFRLPTRATDVTLWAAVDDRAVIHLNGQRIAEAAGWTRSCVVRLPARLLRPGDNVISVEAYNHSGPAGLLIRCAWQANRSSGALASDSGWRAFDAKPQGWPARASSGSGRPASVVCRADEGVWGPMLSDWPTVVPKSRLMSGSLAGSLLTLGISTNSASLSSNSLRELRM